MEEEKKAPEKFKEVIQKIESLNILELSELVKVLEERFGVSSAMPAFGFQAMPQMNSGQGGEKEEGEEKTSFKVELKSGGEQKIQVIKVVKDILGIGLKEAKDFVDAAPKILKEGINKEDAEDIKKRLEEAGASVEIK